MSTNVFVRDLDLAVRGRGRRVDLVPRCPVVLAAEVGGRWSTETAQFLSAVAKARAVRSSGSEVGSRRRGSAGGLAVQPGHFPCPC